MVIGRLTREIRDWSLISGRGGGGHVEGGGGHNKFWEVLTCEFEVLAVLKGGGGANSFTLSRGGTTRFVPAILPLCSPPPRPRN